MQSNLWKQENHPVQKQFQEDIDFLNGVQKRIEAELNKYKKKIKRELSYRTTFKTSDSDEGSEQLSTLEDYDEKIIRSPARRQMSTMLLHGIQM